MVDSDIKIEKPVSIPTDDTSTSGGASSGNVIPGLNVGELFPRVIYSAAGGAVVGPWHYSFHVHNTHASETFYAPKVWLPNALVSAGADGYVSAKSDSASENVKLVIYGLSTSGVPQTDTITLSGTTQATSSKVFKNGTPWKVQATDPATGLQKFVLGNVTLTTTSQAATPVTTTIGMIPAPLTVAGVSVQCDFATAEFDVGMELSLGTSHTTTNRLTAPGNGVTFSRPNVLASGLAAPADMTFGTTWQGWLRGTYQPGTSRTNLSRLLVLVQGSD